MALRCRELRSGREYIILHDKKINDKQFYKGIFISRGEMRGSRLISRKGHFGGFVDPYESVSIWCSVFSINGVKTCFFESDLYYDFNKIRDNANHARNNMEQRALDKILKRLVNEEFKW
jgi:hypothetical protein